MKLREARVSDISQIMEVRNSVIENKLADPDSVTEELCEEFMFVRGKAWVCEVNEIIAGFATIDLKENNIWALFIRPQFEAQGIGEKLHHTMLSWYFNCKDAALWLGTEPGTRAEQFYSHQGWRKTGLRENGEIKMEITREQWQNNSLAAS